MLLMYYCIFLNVYICVMHPTFLLCIILLCLLLYERTAKLAGATVSKVYVQTEKMVQINK